MHLPKTLVPFRMLGTTLPAVLVVSWFTYVILLGIYRGCGIHLLCKVVQLLILSSIL